MKGPTIIIKPSRPRDWADRVMDSKKAARELARQMSEHRRIEQERRHVLGTVRGPEERLRALRGLRQRERQIEADAEGAARDKTRRD